MGARRADRPDEGEALALTGESAGARPPASELRWRLELLAETGAILASSLDTAATLAAVADLVTPALADLCVVYLVDEKRRRLERAEVRCARADKQEVIERLRSMPTFSVKSVAPLFASVTSGTAPFHLRQVTPDFWKPLARSPEHRRALEALDVRELLAVPLVARGRVLGAMALASIGEARRYSDEDAIFAAEIGRRMAIAIDNARLFHTAQDAARRGEEARALSETLLAAAPVGYLLLDPELKVLQVSDVTAELHGRSAADHVGHTLPELLGDPGAALERPFREALEQGRALHGVQVDARLPGFEGEERNLFVNVFPQRDADGELRGVAGVTMDLTERVRGRRMLGFLSDASGQLAETLDLDGTIARMTRLPLGVFADYCAVMLASVSDREPSFADTHFNPGRPSPDGRSEAWLQSAGGSGRVGDVLRHERTIVLNDVRTLGVPDDEALTEAARALDARAILLVPLAVRGATIGVIAYVRVTVPRPYDATEITLGEELARRAAVAIDNARLYQQTERANRAKADFLATMSHELRTPLNAIAGYAELLELGLHGPVTDLQKDDLRRIHRNQRHLLGLINNILHFAKLEAGRVPFHMVTTRLLPLLAGLEELVGPQARAKQISYVYVGCETEVMVRVDQDKVQQIIINLLSNAVKFTEAGGMVSLSCELEGGMAHVRVRDTGSGIPAEKLEDVFEPFVQVESGLTRSAEGTGLGLAISRELAKAMGCSLGVESELGRGSVFTLSIPLRRSGGQPVSS